MCLTIVKDTFSAFADGGAGLIQLPVLIFLGLPFAIAPHKIATVALGIGATIRYLRESALERHFALLIYTVMACKAYLARDSTKATHQTSVLTPNAHQPLFAVVL